MSDNIFIPEDGTMIQNDREDEVVSSFIELIDSSTVDPNRTDKKENIKENIEKKREFHSLLPTGRRPMMKSSLYAIVNRKIRMNNMKPPRIDVDVIDVNSQLAMGTVREGLEEIVYEDLHRTTYDRYDTEGTAFVVLDELEGSLVRRVVPIEDMFHDPKGTRLLNEYRGFEEENIRWFAYRSILKRATFNKNFPEFAEKVASGTPTEAIPVSEQDHDGKEYYNWDLDADIEIFYCYSMINEEPVYCVIAGASATIIEMKKGKGYPYKTPDGSEYLPLVVFFFSDEKLGLYSAGAVDFVKDGAEALKKNLNATLQNVARIVNAPTYMFGSADDADIQELENYYRMQENGYSPIIQRKEADIKIQQLSPQSVSQTYREIKNEVLDDLSERLGFMLRKLDNDPSQRVGIFVRQDMEQGEAIKAIDGRNADNFLRLFYLVYFMKITLTPPKNTKIRIEGVEDELELKPKEVRSLLKDYTPKFLIDTDMDYRMTYQEKLQARDIASNDMIQLYQANITDQLVAQGIAKLKYEKFTMLGLDKIITREEVLASAVAEPPPQPEEQAVPPTGEEGSEEFSPQAESIPNEPKSLQELTR